MTKANSKDRKVEFEDSILKLLSSLNRANSRTTTDNNTPEIETDVNTPGIEIDVNTPAQAKTWQATNLNKNNIFNREKSSWQ